VRGGYPPIPRLQPRAPAHAPSPRRAAAPVRAPQVEATGRRFRDTVLALGGSVAPAEVFELFRGRAPSTEALLRHSGLVGAAA
jgi:hypothetical protein